MILYFGRIGDAGHYLWHNERQQVRYPQSALIGDLWPAIDGGFLSVQKEEGLYLRTEKPPWTIIAWPDYSVDTRPGSNSAFLFRGFDDLSNDTLFREAFQIFPNIISRQHKTLRLA